MLLRIDEPMERMSVPEIRGKSIRQTSVLAGKMHRISVELQACGEVRLVGVAPHGLAKFKGGFMPLVEIRRHGENVKPGHDLGPRREPPATAETLKRLVHGIQRATRGIAADDQSAVLDLEPETVGLASRRRSRADQHCIGTYAIRTFRHRERHIRQLGDIRGKL